MFFSFRAGTPEEVAAEAFKHKRLKGKELNTLKLALNRQSIPLPDCSIGKADHTSAFADFTRPAGQAQTRLNPISATLAGQSPGTAQQTAAAVNLNAATTDNQGSGGSAAQASDYGVDLGQSGPSHAHQAQQQQQQHATRMPDADNAQTSDTAVNTADGSQHSCQGAAVQQEAAAGQTQQLDATGTVAGGEGSRDAANRLQPPDEAALIDRFKDVGGDAWKVFVMASKMGLRPDIIERAVARMKMLQQSSRD